MGDPAIPIPNYQINEEFEVVEAPEEEYKVGRPTAKSYLNENDIKDPATVSKYGISEDRIYMNYPFYGELLKKEGQHYRLKKVYGKADPTTIENVQKAYGPGEFQVRLMYQGKEKVLNLTIEEEKENQASQPNEVNSGKRESVEIHTLKDELHRAKQTIKIFEDRVQSRDVELDEKQRRIRDLSQEVIDTERLGEKRWQEKITRLEEKIDQLKEENKELDKANFELKMDLKYADAEGGFDIVSIIKEGIQNPAIKEIIQNFMKARNGANIHQLPARQNPQSPLNDSEEPQNMNNGTAQSQAQDIANNFVQVIFQRAAETLLAENPNYPGVAAFVQQKITEVQNMGFEIDSGNWINIAQSLVQFAIEHNISNERVADVVAPLLSEMDMVKTVLKSSPVNAAFSVLKSSFNLNLNTQEEKVLKGVLTLFKQKLNAD